MPDTDSAKRVSRRGQNQRAADVAALRARVAELETALDQSVGRNRDLQVEAGRLYAILDAVPGWVSFIDSEQRYCLTNWVGGDEGVAPPDRVAGRFVSDVLDREAYRAIRGDLERSLRGEAIARDTTVPLRGKQVASFRATYTPHRAEDGSIDGVVIVVGRVEDLKRPASPYRLADEIRPAEPVRGKPAGALP